MNEPASAIRTIIIPAAGKGTRMLPATRVTAKELLPVYDRPAIQFAIDEAIEAGAQRIIVVISRAKAAIREFLGDRAVASSRRGGATGRDGPGAEIIYVTQNEPRGLGHAILCCKGLTLPGPFGVILPDDIVLGQGALAEMARHYRGGNMIAAMEVAEHETAQYGIFEPGGAATGAIIPVAGIVEKPPRGLAPSTLAAVGRYILQPMIFEVLEHTRPGAEGEVQLTDAIAIATHGVPLTAFRFSGTRHDCGNHDGLLAASNARQAMVREARVQAAIGISRPAFRPDTAGKTAVAEHGRPQRETARQAL